MRGEDRNAMLRIAACDDNPLCLNEIESILKKEERVETIGLYQDPDELLGTLMSDPEQYDIVCMDLAFEEGKNDGRYYAQELYRLTPEVEILYMTGYNDRFAQYVLLDTVNLLGYLTKPIQPDVLHRYLEKSRRRRSERQYLTFFIRGKAFSLPIDRILYLESHNHTAEIHTDQETYVVYEKLSELAARLPSHFIQCHKSFLVNIAGIRQLEADCLVMRNGHTLPISKSCMAQTRACFFRYIGQNL